MKRTLEFETKFYRTRNGIKFIRNARFSIKKKRKGKVVERENVTIDWIVNCQFIEFFMEILYICNSVRDSYDF